MGKPVRGRWAHEGAWGQIPSGAFMEGPSPSALSEVSGMSWPSGRQRVRAAQGPRPDLSG